eukprot:6208916-Pleurochrysis_carterae.AAC.5
MQAANWATEYACTSDMCSAVRCNGAARMSCRYAFPYCILLSLACICTAAGHEGGRGGAASEPGIYSRIECPNKPRYKYPILSRYVPALQNPEPSIREREVHLQVGRSAQPGRRNHASGVAAENRRGGNGSVASEARRVAGRNFCTQLLDLSNILGLGTPRSR